MKPSEGVRLLDDYEAAMKDCGFPDGHTDTAEGMAFTHRYSMCGNAMSVDVIFWIMKRLDGELRAKNS